MTSDHSNTNQQFLVEDYNLNIQDDPNNEVHNLSNPCYYSLEQLEDYVNTDPPNNFSLMHVNIRSLYKNVDQLKSCLSQLNKNISVIGLSETWLKDTSCKNYLDIPGFNLETNKRNERVGGGVALYIVSNLCYTHRPDLKSNYKSLESIFVEIIPSGKQKNIIVGVIYKPPNVNLNDFAVSFRTIM